MRAWKVSTEHVGCTPDDYGSTSWFLIGAANEFGAVRNLLRTGMFDRFVDDIVEVEEVNLNHLIGRRGWVLDNWR